MHWMTSIDFDAFEILRVKVVYLAYAILITEPRAGARDHYGKDRGGRMGNTLQLFTISFTITKHPRIIT